MSSITETGRSAEWDQYPDIHALIDPAWSPKADRLIHGRLSQNQLMKSSGIPGNRFHIDSLGMWRRAGMVLDVGCGRSVDGKGPLSTPVGFIPNAYGVDPVFEFFPGHGLEGRTIDAYAEDLPFKDNSFDHTFSQRGAGWYAGTYYHPYWSLHEMIRGTRPKGFVGIFLGSGGRSLMEVNTDRIQDALKQISAEPLGRKITKVHDYSKHKAALIGITL